MKKTKKATGQSTKFLSAAKTSVELKQSRRWFYSPNLFAEVLTASSQDEAPEDYRCESLEQKEQLAQATNLHMLKCDKPGFLGKDCNIPCDVVLGSSYPHCESHKICQDASSCFCSWGYTGQDCNESKGKM